MLVVLAVLVVVNLYVFVWDKKTGVRAIKQQAEAQPVPMTVPEHALAPVPPPPPAPDGHPPSAIEGKVAKGDTLGKLLKHSGLTAAETDEIIRALSGAFDWKTIRPGEAFKIERGSDGRVTLFDLELAKNHHVRATRKSSGELTGTVDPPP